MGEIQIISEGGGWYDKSGNPQYNVPNKSKPGETRPTTKRDAKKNDWIPSVTKIGKENVNTGLQRWIENQILECAATNPYPRKNEDWIDVIRADAKEQAIKAANKGTLIHGDIEKFFKVDFPVDNDNIQKCINVANILYDDYGISTKDIETEKSFAGSIEFSISDEKMLWFGGKMDLPALLKNFIADIKTTEFTLNDSNETIKKGKKAKLFYEDQLIQLAGYSLGCDLKSPTLINIFVSTIEDSVSVKEWTKEEIAYGTEIFKTLLKLWWLKNT